MEKMDRGKDVDPMRQFTVAKTGFSDVLRITPRLHVDERGDSLKVFSEAMLLENGVAFHPVEILMIHSRKGAIRGLHIQREKGQGKYIQCISGKLFAVAVDMKRDSHTLGQWFSTDLNHGEGVLIPKECAFGSYAYEDSMLLCACDDVFVAGLATGICWDDKDLKIPWPIPDKEDLIISDSDRSLCSFRDYFASVDGEMK